MHSVVIDSKPKDFETVSLGNIDEFMERFGDSHSAVSIKRRTGDVDEINLCDLRSFLDTTAPIASKSDKIIEDLKRSIDWENDGDIIREIGPDKSYIILENKQGKKVKISVMDLHDIGNLEDDEIVDMVEALIKLPIDSAEGLDKVNDLAKRAHTYLKKELLYTDAELRGLGNIDFKSSGDVVKFLKGTKRGNGLRKCVLAKVARSYINAMSVVVETNREKTRGVLEKKVLRNLMDMSSSSSLSYEGFKQGMEEFSTKGKAEFNGKIYYKSDKPGSAIEEIEFKIRIRQKSLESLVSKGIREKDYEDQGNVLDLLGMEIETENIGDKIKVMDFLMPLAYKYGEYKIKNKGGILRVDLEDSIASGEFTPSEGSLRFLEALDASFTAMNDDMGTRLSTALGYSDVKSVPHGDGMLLASEYMFLDKGSSNNNGLANHKCFEYKRKIAERIRLEGYVTNRTISHIVKELLKSIAGSPSKELKGKMPVELMREMLEDIIVEKKGNFVPNALGVDKRKRIKELFEALKIVNKDGVVTVDEVKLRVYIKDMLKNVQKQSLIKMLEEVLPMSYKSELFPFFDSKGKTSRVGKYTNKIGIENISVLMEPGRFIRKA